MRVLVTGGAGYIGSHVVHALIDAGEKVVVLDDLSTGSLDLLPEQVRLNFVRGDVGDREFVIHVIKAAHVDAVMHLAASVSVPESVRDPLPYYDNNTAASVQLLRAAAQCDVPVIFSSTAAVYGTPDYLPIPEDASCRPESPYGRSKLAVEWMLQDLARSRGVGGGRKEFSHVTLRYFNVAGADPAGRTGHPRNAGHLISNAIDVALGRAAHLEVFGTDYPTPDGTCVRDYVHVCDVANAHIAALAYLRRGGSPQTLNVGYGHGYSVLEVVEAVKAASRVDFATAMRDRRAGDPASIVAKNDKIKRVLDWQEQYDNLGLIVEHELAWERHRQSKSV